MTELQHLELLIAGAYYEDTEGDIIGPMKALANKRWSGTNQDGRRKGYGYGVGGINSPNRAPLVRRVFPDIQPVAPAKRPALPKTSGYSYATERHTVFTEDGQRQFLSIRDRSKSLLKTAGAFRLQEVIAGETGDTWHMLACVDRLVELKEIVEVSHPGVPGQFRIFTT